MRMRTIAKAGEYEVYQDMSGSIFLNGRQFDTAIDAARSVRGYPEVCAELMRQVLAVQDSYVDGITAFEDQRSPAEDETVVNTGVTVIVVERGNI